MVAGTPVTPDEDGSPHAPGAILTKRCTYRESCKSGKFGIGLFCLLDMTPEFQPASVSFDERRECVSSSVQKC